MPPTADGRPPRNRRGTGHHAVPATGHHAAPAAGHHAAPATGHRAAAAAGRRRAPAAAGAIVRRRTSGDWLSSGLVILAGVLLVIGFGFVASRAIRGHDTEPSAPQAQVPALGHVSLPPSAQGPIQMQSSSPTPSASPSPSPSASPTPSRTSARPPPDPGGITVTRSDVPSTVDLSAEGRRDWVHWGEQSTFSLERDKEGGSAILEGAPTASRFRHALSPQLFAWSGGDPVNRTDGTPTGIRTCGKGSGFTISAPAAPATRVLRLYIGTLGARGRLSATLTTGTADASTVLEQRDATMRTAVLTVTYRAPRNGKVQLTWTTDKTFTSDVCAGVALEAATLR